jgi:hypothetical protein
MEELFPDGYHRGAVKLAGLLLLNLFLPFNFPILKIFPDRHKTVNAFALNFPMFRLYLIIYFRN